MQGAVFLSQNPNLRHSPVSVLSTTGGTMRVISSFRDLLPFGVDALTGEADHLSFRILCDLTEQGKRIVERTLSCQITSDPWNRGDPPHVASVLLSQEMIVPIGILALLEHGCTEVWLNESRTLIGIEMDDSEDQIEGNKLMHKPVRVFRYGPTQDRNRHAMTGRIE